MPSPTELTVNLMDLSKADRNANGTMVIERITTKQKLQLKWSYISATDFKTILNAISPVSVTVSYTNPLTGAVENRQMYCGDRAASYIDYQNNTPRYKDFSVDLIEI